METFRKVLFIIYVDLITLIVAWVGFNLEIGFCREYVGLSTTLAVIVMGNFILLQKKVK